MFGLEYHLKQAKMREYWCYRLQARSIRHGNDIVLELAAAREAATAAWHYEQADIARKAKGV
jgi:hypothetical protein